VEAAAGGGPPAGAAGAAAGGGESELDVELAGRVLAGSDVPTFAALFVLLLLTFGCLGFPAAANIAFISNDFLTCTGGSFALGGKLK